MTATTSSYLHLLPIGEMKRRVEMAQARLAACDICPRHCGADRLAGELGQREVRPRWSPACSGWIGAEHLASI